MGEVNFVNNLSFEYIGAIQLKKSNGTPLADHQKWPSRKGCMIETNFKTI